MLVTIAAVLALIPWTGDN